MSTRRILRRKRHILIYCHGCKGLLRAEVALPTHLVCEDCGRMHTIDKDDKGGLTLDSSPTGKLIPAGPEAENAARAFSETLQRILDRHRKVAANLSKLVAMYLRDCAALEIEPEIDIDENPSTDFDAASRENGCEVIICKPRKTND